MGSGYLLDPVSFLIRTLAGLYLVALMLRFLFAWVRADFYNPISQFLVRITNPPLRPLRRIIPAVGRVDTASILLMLGLQMGADALILVLQGVTPHPLALLLAALGSLTGLLFNIFIFAIIIQALLSWVMPGAYHPAMGLLLSLTEPVLRPIRNIVPPMSGIDLSPLFAIILLTVLKKLVVPLFYLAF